MREDQGVVEAQEGLLVVEEVCDDGFVKLVAKHDEAVEGK